MVRGFMSDLKLGNPGMGGLGSCRWSRPVWVSEYVYITTRRERV